MSGLREEIDNLLVDRATEGLDAARWQELLDQHVEDNPGPGTDLGSGRGTLDEGFDWAAAAIDLAYTAEEPMPAGLQLRVQDQAKGFLEGRNGSRPSTETLTAERLTAETLTGETLTGETSTGETLTGETLTGETSTGEVLPFRSNGGASESAPVSPSMRRSPQWGAWAVALAASLVAVFGWAPRIAEEMAGPATMMIGGPIGKRTSDGFDFTNRRDRLLGRGQQVVQAAWSATEDPAGSGVSGDLVWSSELQEGYMLFNGLPVNDAAEWQYQLWIFDRQQDERFPIDGGIFDVAADGSVVVPIRAKLRVDEPYLFAITIEKPGGVVVSSRERLPLVASL